jgi:hypothetical protein
LRFERGRDFATIVAVLCYPFLPGDVKRIDIDETARGDGDGAATTEHAAASASTHEKQL